MKMRIKLNHPGAQMPFRAHEGDSGMDLYAPEDKLVPSGCSRIIDFGIVCEIPDGYEIQIRFRSSTGLRTPLIVPGGVMTVDSGYRGNVGIVVRNVDTVRDWIVHKGDRIAQMVLCPVEKLELEEFHGEFAETERGTSGYGSSGR